VSPKATDEDNGSLRRLAGRGWQTRDGRFTIETASGTWSVVDEEQTDDLGLPLVRGPFRSLTEAKEAIEEARSSGPVQSALPKRPPAKPETPAAPKPAADREVEDAGEAEQALPSRGTRGATLDRRARARPASRATRLIARLTDIGVRDPEGIARKDVAGGVPTVARVAVADRLAELLDGADDKAATKLLTKLLAVSARAATTTSTFAGASSTMTAARSASRRRMSPRHGNGQVPDDGYAANTRRGHDSTMNAVTSPPAATRPLPDDELRRIDAWWRAANYLSVGQIYLLDNPLLREPLAAEHVKPRLLGHWGTTPGLNFIYAHMNRVIRRDDLDAIYIAGPGHGGPGLVANAYLEGTYTETYPSVTRDEAGLRRLFRQFSFPGGIPSHVAPETPGSIHEGGELGYALVHAYGAAFDNPDLVVCCVVGDGEAETGPLAASWHSNKFLNPASDGAGPADPPAERLQDRESPTVLARIPSDELVELLEGYGLPAHPRRGRRSGGDAPEDGRRAGRRRLPTSARSRPRHARSPATVASRRVRPGR
jgi:hypothetical protein